MDQFLTYLNEKYQGEDRILFVLVLTLFTTGLRLGEAIALTFDGSFDFKNDTIQVNQLWDRTKKEIDKRTKGKKIRRIPLPSILKMELIKLRNAGARGLVFSRDGITPIDTDNFRKRNWVNDQKACGLRYIRIHDARHTYATLFMINGGNLFDLSKLLGHSSTKTTEIYAHFGEQFFEKSRDLVALAIPSQEKKTKLKKVVND